MRFHLLSAAAMLTLAGCTVGPDYVPPDTAAMTPAAWRWQSGEPKDDRPRGSWWDVFRDPELNRLEELALASSPSLTAAVAKVEQARAGARVRMAEWAPDIRFNGRGQSEQTSGNLPTPVPFRIPAARIDSFSTGLDLSYEIDLWGRIRREVESARANADAASANYHQAVLTLTGDVSAQYFIVRASDAEVDSLLRTIALREQFTALLDEKLRAGVVPETDLARARAELASARAQLADVRRQRQEASDTLALLCGQMATGFAVPPAPISHGSPPVIPPGVPAAVLERRPDVAAAERSIAAANAQIGVAKTAAFPAIRLTGNGGYLSKDVGTLLSSDSSVWSFGPGISLPVTGWALIHFNVKRMEAARAEAVANYRQAVLAAVRDVESSLAQIRYLGEQADAVAEALAASSKAVELIKASYDRGSVSYLELLDAERTRLQSDLAAARVAAQRHMATVRLIKALGGAW
jgi:multidrug efflux system outer membrane protein